MLVQQRVAVLRFELDPFVGAEGFGVLVDRLDVGVAGQQVGVVRHPLDRLMRAQCVVVREGIVVEIGRQMTQIKGVQHVGHIFVRKLRLVHRHEFEHDSD